MSRDHRKLRAFQNAHQLTLAIYRHTMQFPKDEWFGLRAQLRRAATSTASNIVEGSARYTVKEYFNFLNIARASAAELKYLVGLAVELSLLSKDANSALEPAADRLVAELEVLVRRVAAMVRKEKLLRTLKRKARRLKPEA
jgi:four helix bundle protein